MRDLAFDVALEGAQCATVVERAINDGLGLQFSRNWRVRRSRRVARSTSRIHRRAEIARIICRWMATNAEPCRPIACERIRVTGRKDRTLSARDASPAIWMAGERPAANVSRWPVRSTRGFVSSIGKRTGAIRNCILTAIAACDEMPAARSPKIMRRYGMHHPIAGARICERLFVPTRYLCEFDAAGGAELGNHLGLADNGLRQHA